MSGADRRGTLHPSLVGEPIRRIAVFRALMLGDLLCATPALRALRAAWPAAELTLIGLPWSATLAERLPMVDRFEAFPGHPSLPEIAPDLDAWPGFVARRRAAATDLLVQLHGSGGIVNAMLAGWGARRVAGFVEPGAACPDPPLHRSWPETGHEIDRLLALTDHLGLPRRGRHLDFRVTDADRAALAAVVPGLPERFVVVHAGAQLPSRRWPIERFAAAVDGIVDADGVDTARPADVVLTGGSHESDLTARLAARLHRRPALDLAGTTDLGMLGALLERAELLVSNDTGVMHVAAALGTPSVAVSSGADVARWRPLDRSRHAVLWHDVPCRPCAHPVCPVGHVCALGVPVASVVEAAARLPRRAPGALAGHAAPTRHEDCPPLRTAARRRSLTIVDP